MPGPHDYTDRTVKKLYALSGNICSKPDCKTPLVFMGTNGNYAHVGKICHIKGAKKGSLRYDPSMTNDERRSFENLILLCGTCHDTIDDEDIGTEFTDKVLLKWKKQVVSDIWLPGEHFDEWGESIIFHDEKSYSIPYYIVDGEMHYFTEDQYMQIEKALFVYIVISQQFSHTEQLINYIKSSAEVPDELIENFNQGKYIPEKLRAEWFDAKKCTFIERFFMLIKDNDLRLKDLDWLSTEGNSKKTTITFNKS